MKNKTLFKKAPFVLTLITVTLFALIPLSQILYSKNPYSAIESKLKVMNQILYYINQLYFEDVDMDELM